MESDVDSTAPNLGEEDMPEGGLHISIYMI